ncbi:MAG: hypothetical protein IJ328_04670 [Muribaculaceae bacterium]|nr:hypothetical protein [Muribaculaceae bacterium]
MQILVNGKIATLKKGTSFEFVSENRSFTDSDSYSFSISFPLAGCPGNIAIFGHLNRKDVDNPAVTFDCEIRDRNFYKSGAIAIVELNETEVKAQFLEGRSAQNYDVTLDDVYINELDLGEPASLVPPEKAYTAWQGLRYGQEYVALPWVNSSSGNMQNEVVYKDGAYHWADSVEGLSYFPYLIVIAKRICEAMEYEYDFSEWEDDEEKKYLIICNALPYAWDVPQFARALPHWSVAEFFEKLEPFLAGEFDFNHKEKRVSFAFRRSALASAHSVTLNRVLDGFSTELTREDECEYKETATLKYKECGHNMQKYYSCSWFIKSSLFMTWNSLSDLAYAVRYKPAEYAGEYALYLRQKHYIIDLDMCCMLRLVSYYLGFTTEWSILIQPLNVFGEDVVEEGNENVIELEFVPVCIDYTEMNVGLCVFLDLPNLDAGYDDEQATGLFSNPDYRPLPELQLEAGAQSEVSEYFSVIYVAYCDGVYSTQYQIPYPALDKTDITTANTVVHNHFSMRLKDLRVPGYKIDGRRKFQFSFLWEDGIPDVRGVFYIDGKKYLCEKITATFTENGMSELKKGVFYRVMDE